MFRQQGYLKKYLQELLNFIDNVLPITWCLQRPTI